jgi:DNA-binding beta-propeller fold protein YncE
MAVCGGVVVLVTMAAAHGRAQIAISANDGKAVLVNGVNTVPASPAPDTVTILDLTPSPIRVIGELRVPTSVIGPPQSAALTPDESLALVTSATKVDPADRTKTTTNDVVTVIDLRASTPAVSATLSAGRGASGVSINRAGTLALVANRLDGTVSVFAIQGQRVTPAGLVDLGAPDSGPSHVAITPDGRTALVTRNNDSLISILSIDGTTVAYTKRDIAAGYKPYGLEITPNGDLALVAHIGAGATGGVDTIGVIDLRAAPIRTIDQVAVGPTPEGIAISPDGRYLAVTVMNGSNNPPGSPLFNDFGRLRVLAIANRTVTPVAETRIGHWCQGVTWTRDSRRVVVQCMVERQLQVLAFDGKALTTSTPITLGVSPAGIRIAEPRTGR